MSFSRARCLPLLLALSLMAACGEEKPTPPAPEPPTLTVSLAGAEKVYCNFTPVVIEATVADGTPETVELLRPGQPPIPLAAPYQYLLDCANTPEGTYEFVVQARIQGRAFRSPPKQVFVDRFRPVANGPFRSADKEIRKDAPIRVTFSEPMRTAPVSLSSVSMTNNVPSALSWSEDQKVLTVTLASLILPPETLSLSLRAADFQDLAGNPLAPEAITQWEWKVPVFLTEWAPPTLDNSGVSDAAALAVDRSGRRVAAWIERNPKSSEWDVNVHRQAPSGTTRLGDPLSAVAGSGTHVQEVAVAVDASDRPVVAWLEDTGTEKRFFARRWNGSSWEELSPVPPPASGTDVGELVLAVGDTDQPVLTWRESILGSRSWIPVYRWTGSQWTNLGMPIEGLGGAEHMGYPSLLVDLEGRPVLAVCQLSNNAAIAEQIYVMRWSGTAWQPLGDPLRPASAHKDSYVRRSSLARDPRGEPAIVFELYSPGTPWTYELYFSRHGSAGWSSPALAVVSQKAWRPSAGFDAQGNLWAAWEENSSSIPGSVHLQQVTGGARYALLEGFSYPVFANGGAGAPSLLVVADDERTVRLMSPQ